MIACFILSAATLLCLWPFIEKPVHLDDPLVVWTARQIQQHPGDFYGFNVNWYGYVNSMANTETSPPLTSYYMAACASVLGWSERALHTAFLLPAVALILFSYGLARRLCAHPFLAAAGTLAMPVFILCASTLMRDTLMAALWTGAIYLWLIGLEEKPSALPLAAVFITACSLTKYFGLALVPLLLVYGLCQKRAAGSWLLWLLLPIAMVAAYELWARHLYGRILITNATQYAATRNAGQEFAKLVTALSFVGGCTFLALPAMPLLWNKRTLLLPVAAATILALALAPMRTIGMFDSAAGAKWLLIGHLAVLACGGAVMLALSGFDLWSKRTRESLLLFLWFGGVCLFAAKLNWTIAGRNMLPLAPVASLLIVRRIEQRAGVAGAGPDRFSLLLAPILATAALALALTWGDMKWARAGQGAAEIVASRFAHQMDRARFPGHWGFQYYMEQCGAQPLNAKDLTLRSGDLIILPRANSYEISLPPDHLRPLGNYSMNMPSWLSLQNAQVGAGYYSDNWGPSPFILGAGGVDEYDVVMVK